MSSEPEWDNAHETADYIASFVFNWVLLSVKIAELRRFHTTAGAATGPRAKQIYSQIQPGPRSIVIRSLISFTPLKFVCPASFTPVIPRWGYFEQKLDVKGLTRLSTISGFIADSSGGIDSWRRFIFFFLRLVPPAVTKVTGHLQICQDMRGPRDYSCGGRSLTSSPLRSGQHDKPSWSCQ